MRRRSLWTIGYDTIYALQDIEDDALIGVKSTARGCSATDPHLVALFYAGTLALWGMAGQQVGAGWPFYVGLVPVAGLLAWQM